jgi:hypothetical protein
VRAREDLAVGYRGYGFSAAADARPVMLPHHTSAGTLIHSRAGTRRPGSGGRDPRGAAWNISSH